MDKKMKALAAGAAMMIAGASHAAVSYEVVNMDSLLGDNIGSGSTALFGLTGLKAIADAGQTSDIDNDTSIVKITSDKAITEISYYADGDYTARVVGGNPFEGVEASGYIRAVNLLGAAPIFMDVTYDLTAAPGDFNGLWYETATLSFSASDNITEVYLLIENDLFASVDMSNPLEFAKIEKKLVQIDTTVVPLPAAAWMFGAAILAFAGASRRKQA